MTISEYGVYGCVGVFDVVGGLLEGYNDGMAVELSRVGVRVTYLRFDSLFSAGIYRLCNGMVRSMMN